MAMLGLERGGHLADGDVQRSEQGCGAAPVVVVRPNLWGVNAWYFTGIDVHTGRHVFSVRTGIGTLFNNHYGLFPKQGVERVGASVRG